LDSDDGLVGRVFTRREAVALLSGAGAYGLLWVPGCGKGPASTGRNGQPGTALDCAAKPEMTAGPYYVDEKLTRADIRADSSTRAVQEGVPLALAFYVSRIQSGGCTPLPNAVVDVWQCNALGVYSDAKDPQFDTRGQDWLRGNLTTDANGAASFTTVFPGWYRTRATHVHFKIRSAAGADASYEFTSQLFFDENILTEIYTQRAPYSSRGDAGRLRNQDDRIYRQGGSQLLLTPDPRGEGYAADFRIGIDTEG
jgi:protocatechuate 3,4-dioxygenase beta subunit